MGRSINEKGNVYTNLTVLTECGVRGASPLMYWVCECACGRVAHVRGSHLRDGSVKSCGCLRKGNTKHGMAGTPTYQSWSNMKRRCYNSEHSKYERYGGRGIKVCGAWLSSFSNFYKDMGDRPDGKSLDRIDNDGHYIVDNCKWSTQAEQCRNKGNTIRLEYKGKVLTLKQWADITGIKYKTLHSRLMKGWSVSEVLGMRFEE